MNFELHSISLDHNEAFLENHAAYARACGFEHVVHRFGTVRNSNRAKAIFRYAIMDEVLSRAESEKIIVFADDSVAFHKFEPLPMLRGFDPAWAVKAPHTGRADGALMAFRGGPGARSLVSRVRDNFSQLAGRPGIDQRWDYCELEGLDAFAWNTITPQGAYLMFPFPAYGWALPGASVHALSFNPNSHANEQDWRLNDIAVRHITEARIAGHTPFETSVVELDVPDIPGSQDVGLVTAATPSTNAFARFSVQRLADYCRHHGYGLRVSRYGDNEPVSATWRKAQLLMDALEHHRWAIWFDVDILIHNLDQALLPLLGDASVVMVRDISGYQANAGLVAVRDDGVGRRFLQDAAARIKAAHEKTRVVASRGDQPFFNQAFKAAPAENRKLLDVAMANTHPAVSGRSPFMLHYMGYPNNLRAVVIRHDYEASASHPSMKLP